MSSKTHVMCGILASLRHSSFTITDRFQKQSLEPLLVGELKLLVNYPTNVTSIVISVLLIPEYVSPIFIERF